MKNPKRRRQGYLRRWLRAGVYAGGYCECCNQPLVLIFRYDAVCCPQCNQWIDEKCGDPDCCFCGSRPDTVIEAAKAQDYEAIIIADHGNADHALNEDGTPNTAHSLNPVPCVYVTENKAAKVENGRLADVAPTILKIMGLEVPAEMDGSVLIK